VSGREAIPFGKDKSGTSLPLATARPEDPRQCLVRIKKPSPSLVRGTRTMGWGGNYVFPTERGMDSKKNQLERVKQRCKHIWYIDINLKPKGNYKMS